MTWMAGARGLGAAMLVLAAAVATPALSAAQDPAAPAPEQQAPAPLPPSEPPPAPPPAEPSEVPEKKPVAGKPAADQQAQVPAPASEPAQSAAAGPPAGGARASASATVSVGDNFFSPASVSVAVGDTVTWRNDGAAPHSATAENGSFDTGVFNSGQSRSETFTQAGTISYYCTVHGRAQSGTVRVLGAGGGGSRQGTPGSSAAQTEAQAVASPGAAGTSTSLPATGFAAIGLALVGFALLACGHVVGRLDGQRPPSRRRFLTIY
jgi:plastocyanin